CTRSSYGSTLYWYFDVW
nr:immunoglobulin heavy chain junction region [Mus musculus]